MTEAELTAKMIADECDVLDWNETDHNRRVMQFADVKVDTQAFMRAIYDRGYNAELVKVDEPWREKPYWLLKITQRKLNNPND
jgi:hypothetical protein